MRLFTQALALVNVALLAGLLVSGITGEQDAADTDAAALVLDAFDPVLRQEHGILLAEAGPFTGTVQTRDRDVIVSDVPYVNGRRHGVAVFRYPSGAMLAERTYRDGHFHGSVTEWMESGTLYREANYVNGHEEGAQRMYFDDGSLRANYVVRDGRRYGSMGTKSCAAEVAS